MENQTFRHFTEGQLKTFHAPHGYAKVKQFDTKFNKNLSKNKIAIRFSPHGYCLLYPRIKELPTLAGSFPYVPLQTPLLEILGRTAFPTDFLLAWRNTQAQPEPIGPMERKGKEIP